MPKPARASLTPAQLQIMNLFWAEGELGVADVWQRLCRHRPVARNTVQTMLSRLADRGWLRARADGNAFFYRPAKPRRSVLAGLAAHLLDSAFGGSPSGLMSSLMDSRRISPDEARRIREIIDRAKQEEP
jgi:BlaI family transcriptional regulator, penicillinase repressor